MTRDGYLRFCGQREFSPAAYLQQGRGTGLAKASRSSSLSVVHDAIGCLYIALVEAGGLLVASWDYLLGALPP